MPTNNAVLAVDQYRASPAKLDDAGGNLRHLSIVMGARVADIRDQAANWPVFDVQWHGIKHLSYALVQVPCHRRYGGLNNYNNLEEIHG